MGIFGNKKDKSREDIAELLLETADRIMKKGAKNRSSAEFVRIAIEYNDMIMKNGIDQDRFLLERVDTLASIMREEEKDCPNRDSQLTIKLFETLPDFIKNMKTGIKDKECAYTKSKEYGDALMKLLDDTVRKLENKE
jgi:hypothetical protein